jgi:putative heme degradation protein
MTCDLMFVRIFDPWMNVFSLKYKLYSNEKKHHIAHADVWCRPSECNQIKSYVWTSCGIVAFFLSFFVAMKLGWINVTFTV